VELTPYILTLMGLILLGGCILQGTIGFAFGLFAIPLLIIIGAKPFEAIAIVGTCAFSQAAVGLFRHYKEVEWKKIVWMAILGICVQPLGVYFLRKISNKQPDEIRQVFGVILLVLLIAQISIHPKPRERLHGAWATLAMIISGVLSGMTGMSGPPIVFWVIAHDWPSTKMRATMWAFFLMMIPANLIFQSLQFGADVWKFSGVAVLYIPLLLLGTLPALWLGKRIRRKVLRVISITILVLIAAYAIGQPLLFPQLSNGVGH
jgi:uncharacterized membrane protein YfcA